jgi:hypothetical protein
MTEPTSVPDPKAAGESPGASFRWGARFSPQVLVLIATLIAAVPAAKGTVLSGIFWWWSTSYRQVEYVMDEARPNDGAPYIAGHLAGATEQMNIRGEMHGATMAVKGAPHETFAPGKRIPIWYSERAPLISFQGDDSNEVPVAAMPERPGLIAFLGYLVWLLATLIVGFGLAVWVANRWARTYGNLPMRRFNRRHGT